MNHNVHSQSRARTFHDLRAFAADPGAVPGPAGAEGVWTFGRRYLPLAEGLVSVSVLDLRSESGSVENLPADEFVTVLSGEMTVVDENDTPRTVAAGQSFVLTKGSGLTFRVVDRALLAIMAYAQGGRPGPGFVPMELASELSPSKPPLAELLVGETPSCRNRTDYQSTDGEFMCGVWDSTPYYRKPMFYRHSELMYLLEGSVTFVDELGREGTFSKGDVFLIEAGATCSWDSRERVSKVYAIHRPA